MSTECRCTNPYGGGTRCPSQHVAFCLRERDGECYGECIPIPNNFQTISSPFAWWLEREVNKTVHEFVANRASLRDAFFNDEKITINEIANYRGRLIYEMSNGKKISVWFGFEFNKQQTGGFSV